MAQDQLLHRRLVVAIADDVEALHHRNTGLQHGRQLTGKQRDVLGVNLLAALEELRLLADFLGDDALLAQVGTHRRFGGRQHAAFEALALLVHAFPDEGKLLRRNDFCHVR